MKKLRTMQIGTNLYSLFADEFKSAKYRKHYSDASFGAKLKRFAKTAGMKVVYPALLLQYMMKSDDVSLKSKLILSAALGYFILPFDFIPDFAPVIGFADDLGVLLLVLRQMAVHITPEIRHNAREHARKWFGETDSNQFDLLGVFTELCLTYYFLFEKIYICPLGYLLLYSKGGGGTEPLVYPCNTKRKYPSFAGVYHLGDAFIRSSNLMHNCP